MGWEGGERGDGDGGGWGGGGGGGRLWPQAEGLITVLAKEQKAEGQEGWGRGGIRWRDFRP